MFLSIKYSFPSRKNARREISLKPRNIFPRMVFHCDMLSLSSLGWTFSALELLNRMFERRFFLSLLRVHFSDVTPVKIVPIRDKIYQASSNVPHCARNGSRLVVVILRAKKKTTTINEKGFHIIQVKGFVCNYRLSRCEQDIKIN